MCSALMFCKRNFSYLDPASGIISLSGSALDHESIEHYILTVSASDSGNPVLTATATGKYFQ